MPRTRLAYLVTHPIQYQAPLLRTIAAEPDLDLQVFFCGDVSPGRAEQRTGAPPSRIDGKPCLAWIATAISLAKRTTAKRLPDRGN